MRQRGAKDPIPAVEVRIYLAPAGFQADFRLGDDVPHSVCRDFGGSPNLDQEARRLLVILSRAVERWSKKAGA